LRLQIFLAIRAAGSSFTEIGSVFNARGFVKTPPQPQS
jgi:hypothetical protein